MRSGSQLSGGNNSQPSGSGGTKAGGRVNQNKGYGGPNQIMLDLAGTGIIASLMKCDGVVRLSRQSS